MLRRNYLANGVVSRPNIQFSRSLKEENFPCIKNVRGVNDSLKLAQVAEYRIESTRPGEVGDSLFRTRNNVSESANFVVKPELGGKV